MENLNDKEQAQERKQKEEAFLDAYNKVNKELIYWALHIKEPGLAVHVINRGYGAAISALLGIAPNKEEYEYGKKLIMDALSDGLDANYEVIEKIRTALEK